MKCRTDITAEEARAMLDYNSETGEFRWKHRGAETFPSETPKRIIASWNGRFAGRIAGATFKGRVLIGINNQQYFAHRLAVLITLGRWPAHEVDHINGDTSDNRFCNLREAIHAENMQNLRKRATNTSGYIGVSWCKQQEQWLARIAAGKKQHNLGRFDTKEAAYAAYLKAKAELHPFQPTPRGDANEQAA